MLICICCRALFHSPIQRLAFCAMECDGDTLDAIHTTLARSYLDLEVMLDKFYTVLLRIKLSTLSLSAQARRGLCWATKTTCQGQLRFPR